MSMRKKLIVVGDKGSGKTNLLRAFYMIQNPGALVPTVFENRNVNIELGGHSFDLALWDTAGKEDFDRIRPKSYPDTDVVLVCFSIDSYDCFKSIEDNWIPEVKHHLRSIPFILVGTNKQLRVTDSILPTYEQGGLFAERICAYVYRECSTDDGDGVIEVFETASKATIKAAIKAAIKKSNFNAL